MQETLPAEIYTGALLLDRARELHLLEAEIDNLEAYATTEGSSTEKIQSKSLSELRSGASEVIEEPDIEDIMKLIPDETLKALGGRGLLAYLKQQELGARKKEKNSKARDFDSMILDHYARKQAVVRVINPETHPITIAGPTRKLGKNAPESVEGVIWSVFGKNLSIFKGKEINPNRLNWNVKLVGKNGELLVTMDMV